MTRLGFLGCYPLDLLAPTVAFDHLVSRIAGSRFGSVLPAK
jgi:hypothetical protein